MNRRNSLKLAGLGAGILTLNPFELFSSVLKQSNYTVEAIRNNVHIFKGGGGTIGWLDEKEGYSVVDTQFPDYSKQLIEHLNANEKKPFKYLINSHHHGDHTAGNIAFKGLAEKVVAHENSKANQMRVAKAANNEDKQLYPDTIFSKNWSKKIGTEIISCKYFGRAHTDGDMVTHFENANVAHVGDLVFNRRYPYIDQSAGAHIGHWMEVLEQIKKNYDKDTIFICGHSGDGYDVKINQDDITAAVDYFEKLLSIVTQDIKSGKSKEDIMARTSIPGVEWGGNGIERSLTAAYNELTNEK